MLPIPQENKLVLSKEIGLPTTRSTLLQSRNFFAVSFLSNNNKPLASLSLDLDNKWAYLKTAGNSKWESFPSYFDVCVPRFIDFLERRNLNITVFVVGQDAVLEKNHDAIRMISDAGHEIANHSFHHEPWLHLYTPGQLEQEFELTENALQEITGKKPVGFRGPGFSLSDEVLRTLMRRGYRYDCSIFPTFLGPLARLYFFVRSGLSSEQKEDRKELFGKASDGLQSNTPFEWHWRGQRLIEVPVTTMPLFKAPIHGSYILYLAKYSVTLAKLYFWSALKLCKMAGVEPSILLHPLDFMGHEDDEDLAFFPAMDQPAQKKIDLMSDCMEMLTNEFDVVNMLQYAEEIDKFLMPVRSINTATMGADEEFARSHS